MMIDTRELRIGNLVMIGDKVITMDVRTFHAVIHSFQGYEPEPISLTEEWLLKAGFIRREYKNEVWFSNGSVALEKHMGVFRDRGTFTVIESVHWLQNYYYFKYNQELKLNGK